jgi:hypothetical protein
VHFHKIQIVPKGCKSCVRKSYNKPKNNDDWKNHNDNYWKNHRGDYWKDHHDEKSDWSDHFCSGTLRGYPCCKKIVYDTKYDSNRFTYGHEKGKTCVSRFLVNTRLFLKDANLVSEKNGGPMTFAPERSKATAVARELSQILIMTRMDMPMVLRMDTNV